MIKTILFTATICLAGASFQSLNAQKSKQGSINAAKTDVKFLDDISFDIAPGQEVIQASSDVKTASVEPQFASKTSEASYTYNSDIENAQSLQFKYALLMDLEVEQIRNLNLFRVIDQWLGTPYKLGGNTKMGIDCSAFMQVLFTALYGVTLPRTSKEQFNQARKISRTELKEGDLVFFHTTGRGVSHVGMYLQNNKFVHASSSGVMISDLSEDYWARHLISTGRIDSVQTSINATASQP